MQSKNSPNKVLAAKRRAQALELRAQGMTYERIAKQVGISRARAHAAVTEALEELTKQCAESAALVVRLELERLDALFAAWYPRATGDEPDARACRLCLEIMDRRAKLLGLDRKQPEFHYHKPLDQCTDEELEYLLRGEMPPQVITVKDPPGWGVGECQDREVDK